MRYQAEVERDVYLAYATGSDDLEELRADVATHAQPGDVVRLYDANIPTPTGSREAKPFEIYGVSAQEGTEAKKARKS